MRHFAPHLTPTYLTFQFITAHDALRLISHARQRYVDKRFV